MNRRAFLTGLIAAPLVVRTAGLLMPVKVIRSVIHLTAEQVDKLVRPPISNVSLWQVSWGEASPEIYRVPRATTFNLTPGSVNRAPGEFRPIGLRPGDMVTFSWEPTHANPRS